MSKPECARRNARIWRKSGRLYRTSEPILPPFLDCQALLPLGIAPRISAHRTAAHLQIVGHLARVGRALAIGHEDLLGLRLHPAQMRPPQCTLFRLFHISPVTGAGYPEWIPSGPVMGEFSTILRMAISLPRICSGISALILSHFQRLGKSRNIRKSDLRKKCALSVFLYCVFFSARLASSHRSSANLVEPLSRSHAG